MSSETVKYLVQASLTHHLLASVFDPLFTSDREINLGDFWKRYRQIDLSRRSFFS